jgi:hypothetical protein
LIIFGLISAIFVIIDLSRMTGAWSNWHTASIIVAIAGVLELFFGWIGFRKSDNPGQGNYFITTGLIAALLMLVSMIMYFSIWNFIGFILPVFYIIGGPMLKKVAKARV